MRPLDDGVRAAYLARLGLDAESPSADALARLHRRHVERVPYETLWIHAGQAWDIDPDAAAHRIARERRGGYCYHLNGAFALLLASLGYAVHRHTGGVHGPDGPSEAELGNHLVLTVTGLPTDDHPDGTWYVDLGLGDALHAPLPLRPATVRQGCFELALTVVEDGVGDWHLRHDPTGGFRGMAWSSGPADDALHARQHHRLSTDPESGFVRVGITQTRHADHVEVVRGLLPIRVGAGAGIGEPLTERRAWFDALADRFGLTFDDVEDAVLDRLWARTLAAHREWEAAGRP